MWIAGVDGCRRGWFRAALEIETGELHFAVVERAVALLEAHPHPSVVAVDIPIGLTDRGRRACDEAARQRLGWPRRNSVFPAPIRPALEASSREEAACITEDRDGRKVSAQAWAICRKVREVDTLLREDFEARSRIREVHPEVSFWAWAGEKPMQAGKKTRAGRAERQRLVAQWLGPQVLAGARGPHLKKDLADDDILDAFAALWTARRIARGEAKTLPERPPRDACGLPMEIVY